VAANKPLWPWIAGLVAVLLAAGVGIFFGLRSAKQDNEDDEDDEDDEDEERPKKQRKKKRSRARASD
jgi:hypothetical protein